jgi:hypothetical protein
MARMYFIILFLVSRQEESLLLHQVDSLVKKPSSLKITRKELKYFINLFVETQIPSFNTCWYRQKPKNS